MQLTGNLEDLGLGEIFQILGFSGKSGVLRLRTRKAEGRIVFKEGSVIKATSSAMSESVGDILLKEGRLGQKELEEARERQKLKGYKESLGSILSREFKVPAEIVDNIARKEIEKAVYLFFFWQEGYFVFELGDYTESPEVIQADPLQYTLKRGLNPQFLSMEGLRLLDEAKKCAPSQTAEAKKEAPPQSPGAPLESEQGPVKEAVGPVSKSVKHESDIDTRHYVQDLLNEIGDDGGFPKAGDALPTVVNSKGLKVLKELLEELAKPLTLNEVVLLILRFSSEIINRSVVFTVKNGHMVGFGQSGIEVEEDIPDNRVRKIMVPVGEPSILTDAISQKMIVAKDLEKTPWNEYLLRQLGGYRPVEAFAAPIIVHGRVEMLLYGDNAPDSRKLDDLSTLDIFLGQTSIAMERIKSKRSSVGNAG